MAIRFQKRIKLFGGLGLNIGKRGVSASYRGKYGSIGTKGSSVQTGVPGLSIRTSHKRKSTDIEEEVSNPQPTQNIEQTAPTKSRGIDWWTIFVLVAIVFILKACFD